MSTQNQNVQKPGNQQTQIERIDPNQPLAPVETSSSVMAMVPTSFDGAMQVARWLAQSSLLPKSVSREFDIFFIITAGMEVGIPPMAALRSLYVVNGRTALESRAKMALCLNKGAAMYFRRIEYTPEATTWETLRAGQTEPVRMRYTRQEAIDAFLAPGKRSGAGPNEPMVAGKEGPWRQYTQRMISHRALGWICDDVYPDIVLGIATAEDFDQDEFTFRPIAPGVELQPAPAPRQPEPVSGAPTTAKNANPKKAGAKADAAVAEAQVQAPQEFPRDTSKQGDATPAGGKRPEPSGPMLNDDELDDIIERTGKFTNEAEIKAWYEENVRNRQMTEVQRNKLLNVYGDQVDMIRDSAKREKAGQ